MTWLGALLVLLAQIPISPPTGYVNDFAHVLDPGSIGRMTDVITEVRARTHGEIAVVTLADIGDRPASDVALQIGRAWGVGAKGDAGDPAKNMGVVVLLVPRKDHRPGSGQLFIATGRGSEGFLPDSRVGRIRDAMGSFLAQEQYGPGLALGVDSLAQAFAGEAGVTLQGQPAATEPRPPQGRTGFPLGWLVIVLFLLLLTRGRILLWPLLFGGFGGGRGGGGWGGGGGGGGGGFGGGFGGFGGGGGFSGGGAGGRF